MRQSKASFQSAVAGFLLGSALTCLVSLAITQQRRSKKRSEEKDSTDDSTQRQGIPWELREEQLSRHTLYFGEEGMEKLRSASVVVVGLGGVGSHAAHMLARAGVTHLRLIDFDQVSLSSLNRHACATLEDVGTPKATCLKNFLQKICPDPRYLKLEAIVQMYTADHHGSKLLEGHQWDMVIDAIDDVPTKAALLAHCLQKGFRVVSCMGAGGKSDVTRLHISDLRTASRDPLSSKLRQSMKRLVPGDDSFLDAMEKLAVVYSSEKSVVKLADFTDEQKADGVHQYGAVDGMRIRVLPVLGTMPAIMGQACAALAICELGEKQFLPVTGERVGRNVRNRMHQHFRRREYKLETMIKTAANDSAETGDQGRMIDGKWVGPIQIDQDDVEYLMEIWRNRCAVTGDRLGTVLELVRWDLSRPSCCDNLVIMGVGALQKFDTHGQSSVPEHMQRIIEARLQTISA